MCNPKQSQVAKLDWRGIFKAIGFAEFLNVMAAARRRARIKKLNPLPASRHGS